MTNVEAVLFDLDGTLVDYRRSTAEVLAAAFERAGYEPFFEAETYYERFSTYAEDADSVADLRERCFADIAAERGRDPADGRAVADAYAAERDQTNVEPLPGALTAVETLADEYRLGLVTNGTREMQRTKLAAVGLDEAFETTVFAGDDVPAKPDPEPFERALAALDVTPERAVHVGNSVSADVAGAREAGLRSIWLAGGELDEGVDPEPHHVVDAPADLTPPPWR